MLTLGVILALVGRMAFRLCGREIAGLACLACGLSSLFVWQVQPLRIDHHAWQIAAVMLAVSALIGRWPLRGGALAGLAMAIGLSISIEVLPHAILIGGVLLLRWIRDPAQRLWLSSYLTSLAVSLIALFFLTHGLTDVSQYCDAISPAHLSLFTIMALGCSVHCQEAEAAAGRRRRAAVRDWRDRAGFLSPLRAPMYPRPVWQSRSIGAINIGMPM